MQFPRVMLATTAKHVMGDISRSPEAPLVDRACIIQRKDEDRSVYIGNWATGFGFIDVEFPFDSTHDPNPEEAEILRKVVIGVSGLRFKLGPMVLPDTE